MIISEVSGGLGNQMFGYAFARALSIANDDRLYISKRLLMHDTLRNYGLNHFELSMKVPQVENNLVLNCRYIYRYWLFKALRRFGITLKYSHTTTVFDGLEQFGYFDVPYTANKVNVYRGLFQSARYFDSIRDTLISDFSLMDKLNEDEQKMLDKIMESESVCVHIRRGDYVKSKIHYVCKEDYYVKAVKEIQRICDNPIFFAFSDDIGWVKGNFAEENIICVDCSRNEFVELQLMKNCKHFIISNSTFSWWAQYLAQNKKKIVMAPNKWLNLDDKSINDIYQDNWTLIEV